MQYLNHIWTKLKTIVCRNIVWLYVYIDLILSKIHRYFYRFTQALYSFRCNSLAHLTDRQLGSRLEMIGKLISGLVFLHFGFPFFSLQRLIRSVVNIDVEAKSNTERTTEQFFNHANKYGQWIYVRYMVQRRGLLRFWNFENRLDSNFDLIDDYDWLVINWAYQSGLPRFVLDLLDIRESQGLPRYPQGWFDWEGAAQFK